MAQVFNPSTWEVERGRWICEFVTIRPARYIVRSCCKQQTKNKPKYKIKFPFYFTRFWSLYHIPWRIWGTTLDHRERSFSTSVNMSEKIRSFLSFVVQFVSLPNATTVSTTQHNENEEASTLSLIHTHRLLLCMCNDVLTTFISVYHIHAVSI